MKNKVFAEYVDLGYGGSARVEADAVEGVEVEFCVDYGARIVVNVGMDKDGVRTLHASLTKALAAIAEGRR